MFSKRLQILMDKHKLKPADLARKLEITPQAISKMLKEGGNPSLENLIKLRKTFNVSIDYLLGLDLEDVMDILKNQNYNQVSENVKKLREGKNLTQKEFARFNNINVQDVIDIENGKPSNIDILQKISYFSVVSLYELIGEQNHPFTTDDIEHLNILKFAANLENREFIEIAIKIKNSGIHLQDVVVSRKL